MRTGFCVALLCGLTTVPAVGQANIGKDTTGVIPPVKAPAPLTVPSLDSVVVIGVRRLASDGGERTRGSATHAGLGDIILVKVSHLGNLVNVANCLTAAGVDVPQTVCRPHEIALYIDGREITGIKPESGAPIPDKEELQFHLTRSPLSDEAWADLLGNPPVVLTERFFHRPAELSVGLAGEYALRTRIGLKEPAFELIRFRRIWFFVATLLGVVLIWRVVRFARRTPLLRDAGTVTDGATGDLPPYSLGRVQMAFWFVLVVISFVYIWLITNGWDTINGTVLSLIGIGTGTALGSALIDGTPDGGVRVVHCSRHFLPDILQDGNGYAFHRFQMFVWTLVLGVLFLYSVWQRLSMPEFSATLLGLLGISGGTYLGFKIPETPRSPAPPVPAPPVLTPPPAAPPPPAASAFPPRP